MSDTKSTEAEEVLEIDWDKWVEYLVGEIGFDDLSSESSELYELRNQLNRLLKRIDKHLAEIDDKYERLNQKTDKLIQETDKAKGSKLNLEDALLTYEHLFDRCKIIARGMYEDEQISKYGRPKHILTVQTKDLDIQYGYEGVHSPPGKSSYEPVKYTHLWKVPEEIKKPLR